MENQDFNSRTQDLIVLTDEIIKLLQKIKNKVDIDQKENAENGRYEFAYVKYYLAEILSLLNLSIYLLKHDIFRKYTYFPARLIMEIVLQQEHVYSVKNKDGLDEVRRLFFKDIATSAKSSLTWPGDGGKEKIRNHLNLLNIASKILKLNFNTDNVSAKSKQNIKILCDKSCIVVKKFTGSELYSFYEILSESSHANVVSIGASNHENDDIGLLSIFEISIELAIRFCEMIINESKYERLQVDVRNIKRIAGVE